MEKINKNNLRHKTLKVESIDLGDNPTIGLDSYEIKDIAREPSSSSTTASVSTLKVDSSTTIYDGDDVEAVDDTLEYIPVFEQNVEVHAAQPQSPATSDTETEKYDTIKKHPTVENLIEKAEPVQSEAEIDVTPTPAPRQAQVEPDEIEYNIKVLIQDLEPTKEKWSIKMEGESDETDWMEIENDFNDNGILETKAKGNPVGHIEKVLIKESGATGTYTGTSASTIDFIEVQYPSNENGINHSLFTILQGWSRPGNTLGWSIPSSESTRFSSDKNQGAQKFTEGVRYRITVKTDSSWFR